MFYTNTNTYSFKLLNPSTISAAIRSSGEARHRVLQLLSVKDASISACLDNRKGSLLSLYSTSKASSDVLNTLLEGFLRARMFGFCVFEMNYKEGLSLSLVDKEFYSFSDDEKLVLKIKDKTITPRPPKFFVLHLEPVLLGVLWIAYAKHVALSHYLKFTEFLSVPPLIYKTDNADNLDDIVMALKNLKSGSFGIFSKDDLLDVLSGRGSVADFLDFARYADEEIAKVMLGSTLSNGGGAAGGGSYALAKTHEKTSANITKADVRLAVSTLNTLYYEMFNTPLDLEIFIDSDKDLNTRALMLESLHRIGYALDESDMAKEFDLPLKKISSSELSANETLSPLIQNTKPQPQQKTQTSEKEISNQISKIASKIQDANSFEEALDLIDESKIFTGLKNDVKNLVINHEIFKINND